MAWQQLSIAVNSHQRELAENLLWDHGAASVTYTDAADKAILEPAPGETPLWEDSFLTGLYPEDLSLTALQSKLCDIFGEELKLRLETLADQDWERAWLIDFKPKRFGKRLWVYPKDSDVDKQDGDIILSMDPGLAFGTGGHQTTTLCLEWLEQNDLLGKTLLDYGCGSGILAIAGLLLGAQSAYAVDIDPQALTASADNAEHNGVLGKLQICSAQDWQKDDNIDLLLANILAEPLLSLAETFAATQTMGGQLALSGILNAQIEQISAAYRPYYELSEPTLLDEWVLLSGRRR